ncbi:MAG TPA: hypothetical protein VHG08_28235 [Longimicrobium sp.]|nr:hypothetical protein [Longimicrobium sp.]
MRNWNLIEADGQLREIADAALCCGPQRVTLADEFAVVVLSAAEYARLTGETPGARAEEAAEGEVRTGKSFMEFMQNSPWAEAVRSGDWIWEWDDETRSWVEKAAR